MTYTDNQAYNPGQQMSEADEELFREIMQDFSQMQLWRNTFATQWEEIAAIVLPAHVNTFYYGNFNWPGQKKTLQQIDASAMMALQRFGAIMDSLLTPRDQIWHGLESVRPELMRDSATRAWFQNVVQRLFTERYSPVANFSSQNQQNYQMMGAFGTGAMMIDQACDVTGNLVKGLRYRAIPLGELFLRENHQGLVDGFVRWFRLDARQCLQMFGTIPDNLRNALDAQSQTKFNFLHRVVPNMDRKVGYVGPKGMKFTSIYACVEGKCIMQKGGYHSFPIAVGRYDQAPQEVYGRGPIMMVLPAIKTLNAQKTTFLKQGHRASDPVLLTADDGLMDVSLRPGAMNKGGVSADGRPLVHILPTGNIQINEKMMDRELGIINDACLVSLFQIMEESPSMTATEVIERVNEKGILIAPTVGRQQSEYLGPMIDRELDLMSRLGMLPPMPPALAKAKGAYSVRYLSPLARAQQASKAAGFARALELTTQVVNATQDPSLFDIYAFDRALPDVARIQDTPEDWLATPKELQQKRQSRQQAAEQDAQIKAAPAQAAIMKAQAIQAKAGQANAVTQARTVQPGQQAPQAAQPAQTLGPQQPQQGPGQ
jgi:hypothetical protein